MCNLWCMMHDVWCEIYAICNRTLVAKDKAAAAKREEREKQWDLHVFKFLINSHVFTGKSKRKQMPMLSLSKKSKWGQIVAYALNVIYKYSAGKQIVFARHWKYITLSLLRLPTFLSANHSLKFRTFLRMHCKSLKFTTIILCTRYRGLFHLQANRTKVFTFVSRCCDFVYNSCLLIQFLNCPMFNDFCHTWAC